MRRVLVVDDSATAREEVGSVLRGAGFEVIEVEDGATALGRLSSDRDIHMVILDVAMPTMNGLETLERIKEDARHASLPVVMLTSKTQTTVIERAKKAGARGWIIKPFRPELLLAAVHKLLAVSV